MTEEGAIQIMYVGMSVWDPQATVWWWYQYYPSRYTVEGRRTTTKNPDFIWLQKV
jgi:hypothetical protein